MKEELCKKPGEWYSERPKECLEKKLNEIVRCLNDNLEIAREALGPDKAAVITRILDKAMAMKVELAKMKPEQIKNDSHLGHTLGQMATELGFFETLKKLIAKGNEEKAKACRTIIEKTIGAINDYLEMNLKNKDYFYGEISDSDGYFVGQELTDNRKLTDLNCDEFVLLSQERLENK